MAKKMAARCVHIHSHVCLHTAQGSRVRNCGYVFAKSGGVHGIAQRDEGRQLSERRLIEAIEIGEVARLVDFVNICFLWGEGNILLDLAADIAEEGGVDEILDYAVLVTSRLLGFIL